MFKLISSFTRLSEKSRRIRFTLREVRNEFRKPHKRVPFRQQLSAVECGAACLSMILSYFGRETTVSECREMCGLGRDGLTARSLADAARDLGLRVKAYSVDPADLVYLQLPGIVHWEFNHFLVVEKWSPKRIRVIDPRIGRQTLTQEEFSAGFTGVVLTFDPGVQFERRRRSNGSLWLKYFTSMVRTSGARWAFIQILFASILLQALGLVLPLVTKVIVDQVLPFNIANVMSILGIGMLIFTIAQTTAGYLRSSILIYLRGRLDSQLMLNFFEHLLSLPFSFFQRRASGDLLMRLSSNSLIREMLTNQMLSVILDGKFVLIYLLILLILSPIFSLLVIGLSVVQILIVFATRNRVRNLTQRDLSTKAEEQSYVVEAMKGIGMLKAGGAEDRAFDRWSNLFFRQLNVSLERSQLSAVIEAGMGMLRTLSPMLLLWFGALQVLNGNMKLGTMLAFNSLAASFLAPITALVSSGQQLIMVGAQLERIADVLETEPEQTTGVDESMPQLDGRIDVRNVSFRYQPDAPLVLKKVSFTIERGQKVALVGPTGSGKSTMAMLLLGLYQPTRGDILLDGISLRRFNLRRMRKRFGVVLQESFLFSGSIRQNICLNNPEMALDEMVEVATVAAIDEDLSRMPMGYETIVSEGGATLSGGQRQRLAIARALAHRPSILVLDEATSHLDVQTEARLDHNLNNLHCTRIVIAHRLSTVRNADLILVMHDGEVVEQGTHQELMALGAHYCSLVQSQLDRSPRVEPSEAATQPKPVMEARISI